jgi:8-oxo-dGTP pyrophosphatase MutT (NUDIX family)
MNSDEKVFVIIYKISPTKGLELLCLKPNPLTSVVPGYYAATGIVLGDETPDNAATRLVETQTGLKSQVVYDLHDEISYTDSKTKNNVIQHCFSAKVGHDPVALSKKHVDFRWVNPNEFINTIWWARNDANLLLRMIKIIHNCEV